MRGAVQKEIDRLKNVYEANGYPTVTVVAVKDNLERLLSTPPTDYEQKVRGLVDAATIIIKEINNPDSFNQPTPESRLGKDIRNLSEALTAFRGGEKT